jgi:hypothetical protein
MSGAIPVLTLYAFMAWTEQTLRLLHYRPKSSHDSSVGIATRYGLDGPGIESW